MMKPGCGSGKGKKYIQGFISSSRSKQLLHRVNEGESIDCLNPDCNQTLHNASNYKCRSCHIDMIRFLENRVKQGTGVEYPRNDT